MTEGRLRTELTHARKWVSNCQRIVERLSEMEASDERLSFWNGIKHIAIDKVIDCELRLKLLERIDER